MAKRLKWVHRTRKKRSKKVCKKKAKKKRKRPNAAQREWLKSMELWISIEESQAEQFSVELYAVLRAIESNKKLIALQKDQAKSCRAARRMFSKSALDGRRTIDKYKREHSLV